MKTPDSGCGTWAVNQKLSDIFLQLRISERSGRGVPKIIDTYGKDVFDFRENSIAVNIPFNWINKLGDNVGNKVGNKKLLNPRRKQILEEIRNNPNVTQAQLSIIIGIGLTAIENNIRFLKENRYIERVGSNKTGYWKIKE
ncbi:MAG: winged helix-turn-helix transcriptional regulator [Spirochaetales bacterium]|nr:winged helix-turn-helix transcriptional regulator [Spirochaetales bacterium]